MKNNYIPEECDCCLGKASYGECAACLQCPTYKNQKNLKIYYCKPKQYYNGMALISAHSAEEANKFIMEFKKSDTKNAHDSYGYSEVTEDDVIKNLHSTKVGIIANEIYYCG